MNQQPEERYVFKSIVLENGTTISAFTSTGDSAKSGEDVDCTLIDVENEAEAGASRTPSSVFEARSEG